MDIESLERRNDASIDALESKTALLKSITSGIRGEVMHQHGILDSMGKGMYGVHGGLRSAGTKMMRVMEGPYGKQYTLYGILGGALILYVLYRSYVV